MVVETFYTSRVWQPSINRILQSQLPKDQVVSINFKFYNASMTCWASEEEEDDDDDLPMTCFLTPKVLRAQETINEVTRAELLSNRSASALRFSEVLSRMRIPVAEQPVIIREIFRVLESDNTCRLPIFVKITFVTSRLRLIRNRSSDDQITIRRVANESMDTYEAKPIPAAKSFIQNLKRVSLDDDYDHSEESSCVICMEPFEGGGVEAIRLPCSHIFHENCGVRWLITSHLCPLCRSPVPCEEDLACSLI